MQIRGHWRWAFAACGVLFLVVVVELAQIASHWVQMWPRRELASRWSQEIDSLPNDRLVPRLTAIASLGDEGTAQLVAALGSNRVTVAAAAHQVLLDQLHEWDTLPVEVASPWRAALARELAEHEHFPAASRAAAATLAERLLVAPLDHTQCSASEFVGHCEQVMRRAGDARPWTLRMAAREERRGTHEDPKPTSEDRRARAVPLPTRGRRSASALPSTTSATSQTRGPEPSEEMPPIVDAESAQPTKSRPRRGRGVRISLSTNRESERFVSAPSEPISNWPVPGPNDATGGSATNEPDDSDLEEAIRIPSLGDFELMRYLHHESVSLVRNAETELRRRGFDGPHLDLARRLAHPDPTVRIELARSLPQLTRIDPLPWLKQLAQDEHERVRRAAAAVLVTTSDPQTHRWLDQLR